MIYKFIAVNDKGKEYEFTKTGTSMHDAESRLEEEAHVRGILGELEVTQRFNYELGGKWTSVDGEPYEDIVEQALTETIEQEYAEYIEPEPLKEEEDGQYSLF